MREALVIFILAVAVFTAWLGVAGAARLRAPLDRLHAVAFVNIATGGTVAVACFATEGVTARSLKVLFAVLLSWVIGAALAHATGRALAKRGDAA